MSFVLQFTDANAGSGDVPTWRGALEEVSSGDRRTVSTLEGLVGGLADHGISLAHEKSSAERCAYCTLSTAHPGKES